MTLTARGRILLTLLALGVLLGAAVALVAAYGAREAGQGAALLGCLLLIGAAVLADRGPTS